METLFRYFIVALGDNRTDKDILYEASTPKDFKNKPCEKIKDQDEEFEGKRRTSEKRHLYKETAEQCDEKDVKL